MRAYVIRRALLIVPTLLILALGVLVLASIAPGDPAENYARLHSSTGFATEADIASARHLLGLDRSFPVRYLSWVGGALHGDFGVSFTRNTTVASEIRARVGATVELAVTSMLITIAVAVPLGTVAAVLHGRAVDHILRFGSLIVASVPGFFLAYVLIEVFATRLDLLPVAGNEQATSVLLPAVTLAAAGIAQASRLLRASLLEVMGEDYIRTARAKGLSRTAVTIRHALPNAALPVITVLGTLLGYLLAGSVVIETVYAWPGLGQLLAESVSERDFPMIEGLIVMAGFLFLVINLLVDVCYRLLDPRVRLQAA
ncbi:MAG TPA: ABC transporter permease [Candidatus Dormibacteraeota bacterium]|nr:ABC transporter permease [Candidatus Dormibacteraeota bacterium]